MDNDIQKIVKAAVKIFDSQPEDNLKKKSSGQLEAKREKSDTASVWKDKYLHLLADLENSKKRMERAAAKEIEYQSIEFLKDIMRVADGLDLVLKHVSEQDQCQNIFQGLKGIKNIFDKFFMKYDVKAIDSLGAVFDPNLHDALGMVPNPTAIPHTVVKVEQKGYLYHGKLLRPAQVLVAAG